MVGESNLSRPTGKDPKAMRAPRSPRSATARISAGLLILALGLAACQPQAPDGGEAQPPADASLPSRIHLATGLDNLPHDQGFDLLRIKLRSPEGFADDCCTQYRYWRAFRLPPYVPMGVRMG